MAFELVVGESTDQVPEPFRARCVEKDGKWVLPLDESLISGPKQQAALEAERRQRAAAITERDALKAKAAEMEQRLAEIEAAGDPGASSKSEFERQLNSLKKQYDDRLKAIETDRQQERERREASERQLQQTRISDVLRREALAAGVPKEMVEDLIDLPRFRKPWRTNEQGEPMPFDGDLPMPHPDKPGAPLDARGYTTKFLEDNKGWLPPSNGTGALGSDVTARGSAIVLPANDARDPAKYRAAKAAAEKQGKDFVPQYE